METPWIDLLLEPVTLLGRQVLTLLPNLLAMGLIFLLGLGAAWVAGHSAERVLHVIGFDRASDRIGVSAILRLHGIKSAPSHLAGRSTHWFLLLFASLASLEALHLDPVSRIIHATVSYIPHVIIGAVIGVAGALLSNFIAQGVLIAAVNAGLPPARFIAGVARWAIRMLCLAMVLEQLGIAEQIVAVGFGITWGGLMLALALAFGLGARDLAKTLLERHFGEAPRSQMPGDIRHY